MASEIQVFIFDADPCVNVTKSAKQFMQKSNKHKILPDPLIVIVQ